METLENHLHQIILKTVFNLFRHNGQIVSINNRPMKFVEVCVLGNLRMTLNKGYSGVFELNISILHVMCAP